MKQEWGRKRYYRWPSRKPVWTITALVVAVVSVPLIGWARFQISATALQRFYLGQYMRAAMTSTMGPRTTNRYQLLNVVLDKRGTKRLATDADLVPGVTSGNGITLPFILAPELGQKGALGLAIDNGTFNNAKVYEYLQHWVYQDQALTDLAWPSLWGGLALGLVLLIIAIPKDIERARVRRHGRRLKGPELVTAAEFNTRNQADGIGFVNLEPPTFAERVLRRHNRTVSIAREREAMHFLIMGDSGTGKSALIRQLLMQIDERGESVDTKENRVTIERENGEHQTYDPRRLAGVRCITKPSARSPKATACSSQRHRGTCTLPIASWAPSRKSTTPATSKSARTQAARLRSTSASIRISITVTR